MLATDKTLSNAQVEDGMCRMRIDNSFQAQIRKHYALFWALMYFKIIQVNVPSILLSEYLLLPWLRYAAFWERFQCN